MRSLPILAATLAIPAVIASAQTPTPPTGQGAFIPLFGSIAGGAGGSGGGASSTWYIDTARNLVVLCAQSAPADGGSAQAAFTCTAQAVPTAATTPPGGTPPAGGGTPPAGGATPPSGTTPATPATPATPPAGGAPSGGAPVGGAGSNPLGG
ncbi:MAG TPA: hypothetical protein VEC35_03555 [Noviherbaspirillum sp.]|nr:hypothetical protein [Noviherbaspirillum sp.]